MIADSHPDLWGCPDWLDHAAYPSKGGDLKDWEWKWEFLRRFEGYRKLWAIVPPNTNTDAEDRWRELRPKLNADDLLITRIMYSMRVIWNPYLNSTQTGHNPFDSQGGALYKFPPREYWEYFREHGRSYQELYEAILDALESEGLLMGIDEMSPTDLIAFARFDLTRPIRPQLTKAKAELKSLESINRSPRFSGDDRENYPFYIRFIDAQDQGAKPVEIYRKVQDELEANDLNWEAWEDIDNPAAKIMNMQKSARQLMKKAALYL